MSNHASSNGTTSFLDETHTVFGHHKNVLLQWLFSIDHKRISIMYLIGVVVFFLVAALLGVLIRLELFAPGGQILTPDQYNRLFTLHGVIMTFLFVIPAIPAVLGNFLLPLQLGARDVSFPRLNLLTFWLYLAGAVLALITLFSGNFPDTGWTFYAPYSTQSASALAMALTAAFILGVSSILSGINFITTIHRLRAPGMTFFKMPLFVWGVYAASWVQVLATPIIGLTLLLVIAENVFQIGIFDPSLGGDPILYQHLFWIYAHPAVYLMVLPAFGVISEIVVTFSRRTIFGYKAIAISSLSIAFIGYFVWAHHLFTAGISDWARILFSFLTLFVAVPTGIKFYNWVATMYKASIVFASPMLWILGVIFSFTIAGLTGVSLALLNVDIQTHDTYYVVAHFHFTMLGGVGFLFFAAVHYWFPKMTGRMYNESVAKVSFWMIFIGLYLLWVPMFIAGYMGMPRRYFDYLPEYEIYHQIASLGSWIIVPGFFVMFGNLFKGALSGEKAADNPWNASTLEWYTSSPPPLANFNKLPYVDFEPYDYKEGKPVVKLDLS